MWHRHRHRLRLGLRHRLLTSSSDSNSHFLCFHFQIFSVLIWEIENPKGKPNAQFENWRPSLSYHEMFLLLTLLMYMVHDPAWHYINGGAGPLTYIHRARPYLPSVFTFGWSGRGVPVRPARVHPEALWSCGSRAFHCFGYANPRSQAPMLHATRAANMETLCHCGWMLKMDGMMVTQWEQTSWCWRWWVMNAHDDWWWWGWRYWWWWGWWWWWCWWCLTSRTRDALSICDWFPHQSAHLPANASARRNGAWSNPRCSHCPTSWAGPEWPKKWSESLN